MIHEIWSALDDLRHYWIDEPVWGTLCGETVTHPYTPEEIPWDSKDGQTRTLCGKCGEGAETLYNLLRQDLKQGSM